MEIMRRVVSDVPDNFKNPRNKNKGSLKELIAALSTCIENYKAFADNTDSVELKEISQRLADERSDFVNVLRQNFKEKTERSNILSNKIKPIWANLVHSISSAKNEEKILEMIIKSESIAIKKYDNYLFHHIPVIEHLTLLIDQKNSIRNTIALFKADNSLYMQSTGHLVPELV
jgi:uncharacterized protein (TIGR02284 family)